MDQVSAESVLNVLGALGAKDDVSLAPPDHIGRPDLLTAMVARFAFAAVKVVSRQYYADRNILSIMDIMVFEYWLGGFGGFKGFVPAPTRAQAVSF